MLFTHDKTINLTKQRKYFQMHTDDDAFVVNIGCWCVSSFYFVCYSFLVGIIIIVVTNWGQGRVTLPSLILDRQRYLITTDAPYSEK